MGGGGWGNGAEIEGGTLPLQNMVSISGILKQ